MTDPQIANGSLDGVAVIGMSCRFPGALGVDEFWQALARGEECVTFFTAEELVAAGLPREIVERPDFVPAAPMFPRDAGLFDAAFFGFSPREAELTDPQQRVLLECAWEALEVAGYDPAGIEERVGVFAGASLSDYAMSRLLHNPALAGKVSPTQLVLAADKDYLAALISYKLNLRGPSVVVQAACATSLVAIHTACQNLLTYQCDMALAGGVSLRLPQKQGYFYTAGDVRSPDGHCRAFDADGAGTIFGSGAGMVALKRLEDALADGDRIDAVIRGSAINSDGAARAGFTAPGVQGQAEVIAAALAMAEVEPETISYVEAHGTGTELGDPVEIAALQEVFGDGSDRLTKCAIGSVKTNVGHLESAAGIAGFIKTVLALQHRQIPPSLHFRRPNPRIDFDHSPFRVNTELRDWPSDGLPRRAGVSSFGIGGTNAHAVLEEAPGARVSGPSRSSQLLVLSARTESALDAVSGRLAEHLEGRSASELADTAYTLALGRTAFDYRRTVVCRDAGEAVAALSGEDPRGVLSGHSEAGDRPVAFLFPGQGAQYAGMARGLAGSEPLFRRELERCLEIVRNHVEIDLRSLLLAGTGGGEVDRRLARTDVAQPALFSVAYALARLWISWGVSPQAMLGHSIGEYVAACLAGTFQLEDAVRLVAARGRLMASLPPGAMLTLPLSEDELAPLLGEDLSLAAVNGPSRCVVSGPEGAVARLEERLRAEGVEGRRLRTSHAFHSAMMDPILEELEREAACCRLGPPSIPFLSNVSGSWIRPEQATDPAYWAAHARRTVRFADGLAKIYGEPNRVLLEVGPGRTLTTLARRHPEGSPQRVVLSSLPAHDGPEDAPAFVLETLGRLWLARIDVDWRAYYDGESRRRAALPTYPFERRRFWLESPRSQREPGREQRAAEADRRPIGDWFYVPKWQAAGSRPAVDGETLRERRSPWLVFDGGHPLLARLVDRLRRDNPSEVVVVRAGERLAGLESGDAMIDPRRPEHYTALLGKLRERGRLPRTLVHGWSLGGEPESFEAAQWSGLYSLLYLNRALVRSGWSEDVQLTVLSDGLHDVTGEEKLHPWKATLSGALKVIPQEYRNVTCQCLDVMPSGPEWSADDALLDRLLAEIAEPVERDVAFRGGERRVQVFEQLSLPRAEPVLRDRGVYLVTGGFGHVGRVLSRHLAETVRARLVLIGRSPISRPGAGDLDARVEDRRRHVRELEQLGAEVLALSADVADPRAMKAALREAHERFGSFHGVVHAAGIVPGGDLAAVEEVGPGECERHFRAKVDGLRVLDELLAGSELDFGLLFSSLASILGGLGFAPYAAANRFVDAFACAASRTGGVPWRAVDWDAWSQSGTSAHTAAANETPITPVEGTAAFERLLGASEMSQIAVSTSDLEARIGRWVRFETPSASGGEGGGRAQLGRHARPALRSVYVAPRTRLERSLAEVWQEYLGIEEVGVEDNFFELGGDSLLLVQVRSRLRRMLERDVQMADLMRYPTVATLATFLGTSYSAAGDTVPAVLRGRASRPDPAQTDVAVIGMSGRFPGARNLGEFWHNLREGVESISFFSDEELEEAGYHPEVLQMERFVKALPLLEDTELFDAKHFGITPREAASIDPQQRIFLETAWEALEHAGYDPGNYPGLIGTFAGAGVSSYWLNVASDPKVFHSLGVLQMVIGNDKDYLPTRVSFKLNLRGPSVNVQSACSTSLIAVHLACRSLLNGECDMALAGGVAMTGREKGGYFYEDGGMLSLDGHCRAFDARARGTIFGSGSGVVVLKPLAAALADGDTVHAVVKGSAINNDGSLKAGYTAPGVDGQVRVVRGALAAAAVEPETISYVEAHGTATQLGDPIEVTALREVFGRQPGRTCALGSVKSNIGHADAAAGIAGLLKTILALKHRQIPPSLHFEEPNPEIDFENSPFYVNVALSDWKTSSGVPRRAGVSAFGVGGSNAHVVLEEAPPVEVPAAAPPWQLLVLSGRTQGVLDSATVNLARHLESHPELPLADVAHTLQIGRRAFACRRFLVCSDVESAAAALRGESSPSGNRANSSTPVSGVYEGRTLPVLFLFPGQGAQYVAMGRELYESAAVFRRELDRCCELLQPHLNVDLRSLIYPATNGGEDGRAAAELLNQTRITQPALFAIETALARQWLAWGVEPAAMVGHSIGEYVAAHLAGVFSLSDALKVVAERGRLMQSADPGAMVTVPLAAEDLLPLLAEASPEGELSLAAHNAPERSVGGGTFPAVDRLVELLEEQGIEARRLHTSHAFHSSMMDPILDDFRRVLETVELGEPQRPFFSNVSGRPMLDAEATDPDYWVRHVRQPVRFADAVDELCRQEEFLLLEVGPSRTLGSLAKLNPLARKWTALQSLPGPRDGTSDRAQALSSVGRLWLAGVDVRWSELSAGEQRRRVPLPTYPFERQRYIVEDRDVFGQKKWKHFKKGDLAEWFYIPSWRPSDFTAERELDHELDAPCLVFADEVGLAERLVPRLAERLDPVLVVRQGEGFGRCENGDFAVDPARREHFAAVLRELSDGGRMPRSIVFLWGVTPDPSEPISSDAGDRYLVEGIYALFHLAQLLEEIGEGDPMHLLVVSTGVHAVDGSEPLVPEKGTLVGPSTVIPQEYRNILGHSVDLVLPRDEAGWDFLLDRLLEEIANPRPEMAIAYRRRRRWVQAYEQVRIEAKARREPYFREGGCYLITGGLGGLGLLFARHLAAEARARLVLTGRSALPERDGWAEWLEEHSEDDSTSRKILMVQELEALGAEVMVVSANVADLERMTAAVEEARRRFGPIRGVLHAAGLPSGGLIQNKELETVIETLEPKVRGTRVLETVLAGEELDFFVLFSSSGAILGGLGYYDYGAANAFLDAYAHARSAAGHFTLAINWGPWQEAGMAVVSNMGFTDEKAHQAFLRQGISTVEGMEIFHRALDRRFPQVAVWTMDFLHMIEHARLLRTSRDEEKDEDQAAHARPELAIEYAAPRDEVESDLSEIWQDLLGIDQVGIQDDFFELGADSLLATQMLSRVRRKLGVSIPHHKLFETPNIEALAVIVREADGGIELDEVEALLTEVEEMSESEIAESAEASESEARPLAQPSRRGA